MSNEAKELKFVCPKCGGNEILSIENATLIVDVTKIRDNGDFDYGDNQIGDGINDSIDHYECADCNFIIDDNESIDDPTDLADWIKENCKQE